MNLITERLVCVVAHEVLRRPTAVVIEDQVDLIDRLDHGRRIREGKRHNVQPLPLVQLLLGVEHFLDEEVLQPLIGEINAQLLKAVDLEPLSPKPPTRRLTMHTRVMCGRCVDGTGQDTVQPTSGTSL